MKHLFTVFILLFSLNIFAQIEKKPVDYNDETRRVYWFDVALKTRKDPITKMPLYYVYRLGSRIKYGTAYEYDKYLWKGLSNGSKIAVGPFNDLEQAEMANRLYDMKNVEDDSIIMNDNGTYYWYLVTIKKTRRLRSYDFERIPARVVGGTYKDFINLMKVSLPVDKLVIGAFASRPEAENSKRVFRLEE